MAQSLKCEKVSDVLKQPIGSEDWSEARFQGSSLGTYLRVISQPQGDIAIKRLYCKSSESDTTVKPWTVKLTEFKPLITVLTSNSLVDVKYEKKSGKVTSFMIKLESGQIAFYGGNIYLRNLVSKSKLRKVLSELDGLFPV